MNLKGRDIVHQNLHPKIAAQERLFHPNSSLNWLQIDDPELGMHSVGLNSCIGFWTILSKLRGQIENKRPFFVNGKNIELVLISRN